MDTTMAHAPAGGGNYREDVAFGEALSRFFKNYINFEGRSNRGEFWKAWLACFVVSIVANIIDAIIGVPILGGLWSLAIIVPQIAIGARRLHDIDRSGWWQLLVFIPLIGFIILIVWFAKAPENAPNRFG
ncbi:MAG: DUF805 domain-containing protein [Sagittula sp.]|jgi:uncharacterized membrane protein YhaH (DUF805 family)|uniref:DUF805 domain-containing protein n=1 Tax=unclassified Sagittula TaxID=2624628 RepID=UPI000C2D20C3|nr:MULTISPECIES: DUF805 domain-containing protein [unclassified Sagittula]AUC52195.1 DUF805 domain-containing protein [Sagittula sp. P11]WHZ36581.1 DUF805 domain-containing protein [Sagittula sp. MA-2]